MNKRQIKECAVLMRDLERITKKLTNKDELNPEVNDIPCCEASKNNRLENPKKQ